MQNKAILLSAAYHCRLVLVFSAIDKTESGMCRREDLMASPASNCSHGGTAFTF
jgi:hypothetical protein